MAGRINDDDIALVRERTRIEDVVGAYVQLKPAGGGSYKGLCPFHDEKTPSFQVTPSRGLFYCFGCGVGGDVITFMEKIDNLSFTEAVQVLADRAGVRLRITDDGQPRQEPGLRQQILSANQAAAEFYAEQITTPEAIIFRQFVDNRGFDRATAEKFGMGYAPTDGRALHKHLNARGFKDEVLVKAGLIRAKGGWDYFQGRVLWPIRDAANSVLGFGARKVYDNDRLPAKYINTPETVVYQKSNVLYGLDLARRPIGKKSQAVVVEGYTDVMACHLSGIDTAVASCGTAFGEDHARILQRLMGNNDVFHGEVIFTFDGDKAGQNAALKVFALDQTFTSQTYVAVDPNGLDPCDLRLQKGEAAVRDLIGRRIPLYRFVMENTVEKYDLDRADGRVAAVRAAAPLVTSVRDRHLTSNYIRELAQMVGMDPDETRRIVTAENRQRRSKPATRQRSSEPETKTEPAQTGLPWPDPNDRNLLVERGCLKLMLQYPLTFDTAWNGVEPEDFSHPTYRALFEAIKETGYGENWTEKMAENFTDETLKQLQIALLVEPVVREPDEEYSTAYVARLKLLALLPRRDGVKSKLQRTNPVTHKDEYQELFTKLLEMEEQRRELAQLSAGVDI